MRSWCRMQIYNASEKITRNNLTSDVFLAKPRTGEAEGGQVSTKSSATITDLICLTCDVKFKKQEDLNVHLPSHEDVKPFTEAEQHQDGDARVVVRAHVARQVQPELAGDVPGYYPEYSGPQ